MVRFGDMAVDKQAHRQHCQFLSPQACRTTVRITRKKSNYNMNVWNNLPSKFICLTPDLAATLCDKEEFDWLGKFKEMDLSFFTSNTTQRWHCAYKYISKFSKASPLAKIISFTGSVLLHYLMSTSRHFSSNCFKIFSNNIFDFHFDLECLILF